MRNQIFIYICFIFFLDTVDAQLSYVSDGWSGNSINTVIFRKNSIVSANGFHFISWYDPSFSVMLAKRSLNANNWEIVRTQYIGNIHDAHCSISIMIDGDGYLHMAWNQHNNALHYCRSINPGSLILSDILSMIGTHEDCVSYPEFYRLPGGDLIFIYRDGSSGNGNLIINRYSTIERFWKRLHTNLIDCEGVRNAYWQSFVDCQGIIHVSWVWRESSDVATNHDICYARSCDGGMTWEKSNGEKYQLPITLLNAEYIYKIPMKRELINQTSMIADSYGNPYIVGYWSPINTNIPQYHLIYCKDTVWRIVQISSRKSPFSLSGIGTKKIPIARPQIVLRENKDSVQILVLFRDEELGNKVSCFINTNSSLTKWQTIDLTDFSVGNWEPTYDTESWRDRQELYLFVQFVAQGDAETVLELPPQPIYVLHVPVQDLLK